MNENTPHLPGSSDNRNQSGAGFFSEILRVIVISVMIVLPIRLFIAQPYIVSGSSMDPTFETRDYIIVDQFSYHVGTPERQEVIVFRYPEDPSQFFIKRVIGLPGETVTLTNGSVSITNEEHPEGFSLNEPYIVHSKSDTMSVTLAEEEYFVMGDNRRSSLDSRIWGSLSEDMIVGRAFLRLLPLRHIGLHPGSIASFDIPTEQ